MRSRFWFPLGAVAAVIVWTAGAAQAADTDKAGAHELIFRSTVLEKLDVYNRTRTDDKLGHLSDLLIDAHSGMVLYGVLDTGIFGKYIAVPWTGLQMHEDAKSHNSLLTLNKTSDELKAAPIFDKSNPPDFASSEWRGRVDQFFGVQSSTGPQASGTLSANDLVFRSSQLEKLNTYNQADHSSKLGSLDDLIIDAHTGQVMFGVLDTGIGGKFIPVPWTVLLLNKDRDKDFWLSLNKTTEELKSAPSIDLKRLPDFNSEAWTKSVNDFFGVHMVARPAVN